jgi:mRNA degradation ribonuclease J1/J2
MVANAELAKIMGVAPRNILLCQDGDVIEIADDDIDFSGRIPAEFVVPQNFQRSGKKSKDKSTKKHKKH